MKALVTGASGFVGKFLVTHLIEQGDDVVGCDARTSQDLPCHQDKIDITIAEDCSRVITAHKPDVIYHLAGMAFVPDAEADFEKALKVNVAGTSNILRTCHLLQSGIRVVVVSSAEVYGRVEGAELPIREETPIRPANNYSLTKVMAELVAERYGRSGYVRPIVMRPFNHIGPGQDKRFVASSFAFQLSEIAKGRGDPKILVGNLSLRRDFTDVRDVVRAYRLAALKGAGLYNLASGKTVAIREILDTLISVSGVKVEVMTDPNRVRQGEVHEIVGSYEKAKRELGWEPKIQLSETLRDLFQYWIKQSKV